MTISAPQDGPTPASPGVASNRNETTEEVPAPLADAPPSDERRQVATENDPKEGVSAPLHAPSDEFDNVPSMPCVGLGLVGEVGRGSHQASGDREAAAGDASPTAAGSETPISGSAPVSSAELTSSGKHGYRLAYFGDGCLTSHTIPVKEWSDQKEIVVDALRQALKTHKGLGLAANQIRAFWAIAVMKIGDEVTTLVNPFIGEYFNPIDTLQEGSLSIPGFTIRTPRNRFVTLCYERPDALGQIVEVILGHVEARCAQHLVDQLKGIMIVGSQHSRQLRRNCERAATKARGWS